MSEPQRLLKPLTIGKVTTRNNLILSPMSGVTDSAFRRTVQRASGPAVGLLVSEFIAAEGLTRDNGKTRAMLRYLEGERPISIQIFGADVDRMVRAALMVEECGADIVDINCGCPAPKVVRRGGGAQLMRTPDLLRDIIRGIRGAVSIPVTLKIRAGWDDANRNALDIAKMAEDEGICMLAVHPRTRLQLYSGTPDWDLIGEIHHRLRIPVAGSGDIVDPQRALDRLAGGFADAIMIGRGAIDEPWIFAQIDALDRGAPVPQASADDRAALLHYFRLALEETREERSYLGRLRGLAYRMARGIPGGPAVRRALSDARTASDVEGIFRDFLLDGRRFEDRLSHVA